MEPPQDIVEDFYGNKEYVGPDPYGHFHTPAIVNPTSAILANVDIIQPSQNDSYGRTLPYEKDWYADTDPSITQPIIKSDNSIYTLFIALKRRTFWYVWKRHSDDYSSYKDFKSSWEPKNSIRKEILNDIKSGFNSFSKKNK